MELPVPAFAPDAVLVRVRACGICGSDVHGMDGRTGRRISPLVMGHEAAGEIFAVGSDVDGWGVGDRVTFDSTIFCGRCEFCRRGQINLCDDRQVLGVSCAEYRRQGAFAEFVAVPARVLCALPEGLSYERAAMVEPVSVAVHGVHRAGIGPGSRVAVIGVGMIGLLVVQVLKAKGAGEVIAVDIDPAKLELALALGADRTAASSAGMELDAAIEAVGVASTVEMAIRSVRKGGSVGLVGNLSPSVEIPLQAVVTRELTLSGSCASQGDYGESLDLIASGRVRVDPLISERVPLEGAAEAFARLYRGEKGLMKVMVCP
ncbi:galactitol-1-phosphate 5-dehydrogenase [soil metagenome]